MSKYYVKINGSTVSNVKEAWSQRVLTNRTGKFSLVVSDPDNSLFDSVSSGDEVVIYRTSDDAVMYGGYLEKPKRDGGKKYVLKLTGGDYTIIANQRKTDVLIYRNREYSVVVRDIANRFICDTDILDAMEATTGWIAGGDWGTLTADTANDSDGFPFARLGDACLKVTATYSGGTATLTKTMTSTITVNSDDFLCVYFFVADTDDLGTNVRLHFGQDSSNYYTVTIASSVLADGWNYLMFDTSTKTTGAGSPTLTSVDYFQLDFDIASGVSSVVMRFDDLRRIENNFLPTNISITTNYVEYIEFKNVSVFQMWKKVSELRQNTYNFYIDKSKIINWGTYGSTASGETLTRGGNLFDLDIWEDDQHLVNHVFVYGAPQQFSYEETFSGDGSETEFILTYRPVDVYIEVGGVKQLGYKEGMATSSFDYTVDREARKIIFQSGSVPTSGSDNIYVRYTYNVPVIVETDDSVSIDAYGERTEKIENEHLATRADCVEFASEYVKKHKDPITNGIAKSKILPTVDVGETIDITHAKFWSTTQTFTVAAVKNFYVGRFPHSEFTLSNVRQDIEQYLTELLIRLNAIEEKEKGSTELKVKLKSFSDSLTLSDDPANDLTIEGKLINDSFALNHDENSVLYSDNETSIVDDFESSANWTDAGTPALTIANNSNAGHFWVGSQGVKVSWVATSGVGVIQNTDSQGDLQNVVGVVSGTPIQGTAGVWVYMTTGSDISDLKLRIGSSATNYKEYIGQTYRQKVGGVGGFTISDATRTYVLFDLDSPDASSGTVIWTAIDFVQFRFTIAAAGDITFDYFTLSRNNTIGLNGLGDRSTTYSAQLVANPSS